MCMLNDRRGLSGLTGRSVHGLGLLAEEGRDRVGWSYAD
jgi:hypothetical protein